MPRDKITMMLTDRRSYQALEAHYQQIHQRRLRDLFAEDPARGERMHAEAAGLYLDYAKNRITDETLRLLVALAEDCDLRKRIDAMFRGDKINLTEERSVLQTALRAPRGASVGRRRRPPMRANRSSGCWGTWRSSPTSCAPANGSGLRGSRSATS